MKKSLSKMNNLITIVKRTCQISIYLSFAYTCLLSQNAQAQVQINPSQNQVNIEQEKEENLGYTIEKLITVLNHPEGIIEGLNYLLELPIEKLREIKAKELFFLLDHIAMLKDIPIQIRLQTIEVLKRFGSIRTTLHRDWKADKSDQEILVDRALAEYFRALHRVDLLKGSTYSKDPEVRVHGAIMNADLENLCALMQDPWPFVRIASLTGMGKLKKPPQEGQCIIKAITDPKLEIAVTAVKMSAILDDWHLNEKLIKLFENPQTPFQVRVEILVTLGKRGEIEYLEKIIQEHIRQEGSFGQVEEFVMACARGLAIDQQKEDVLLLFKKTHLSRIRIEAARLLLSFGAEFKPFIQEVIQNLGPQEQNRILSLMAPIEEEVLSDVAPKLEEEKEEEEEVWLGENPLLQPKNENRQAIGESVMTEEIKKPQTNQETPATLPETPATLPETPATSQEPQNIIKDKK